MVVAVITMPLNVALWALRASLPLRFAFQGKSLAATSLIASIIILGSIILFKPGLALESRVAGAIAAPIAAVICYFWWLGRQQPKSKVG
jgi:hypothetical protein